LVHSVAAALETVRISKMAFFIFMFANNFFIFFDNYDYKIRFFLLF
jgi:hypothetical protein